MAQTIETMPDGAVRVSNLGDGQEYLKMGSGGSIVFWGAASRNGFPHEDNVILEPTKALGDYMISAFGPEAALAGIRAPLYNLTAGPNVTSPWFGFYEESTHDGTKSVIVASMYNSYAYYGTEEDIYYCDIAGNLKFVGNGNPVQWDSVWNYWGSSLQPQYNAYSGWSQGFMAPVVPGLNGEYGVYFDQSFFLVDTIFTDAYISPAIAEQSAVFKSALQCKMKDFYSEDVMLGRSLYTGNAPGSILDAYTFFGIFYSYYGYFSYPDWIEFYPSFVPPSYFWKDKKHCIEII